MLSLFHAHVEEGSIVVLKSNKGNIAATTADSATSADTSHRLANDSHYRRL